jgi:chromosome segregation ATPase
MQAADVLYGVTQQEPGISTLMSVKLVDEAEMAA